MALIGDARGAILHAKHRSEIHRRESPLKQFARERRDLHRQHADAEALHELRIIGDDDEPPCCLLHNLLAQQRPASSFDQAQLSIDLVRAIDGQIEWGDLRQRVNRNSERSRLLLSLVRCARAANIAQRTCGQSLAHEADEFLRRAAGAQAEGHAALHLLQRRPRSGDFHLPRRH